MANRGGWTGLDFPLLRAVHEGAQPADPLPPLEAKPLIRGVHDVEVRIVGAGPERRVAVYFSYEPFPGVRFGHRFERHPSDEITDGGRAHRPHGGSRDGGRPPLCGQRACSRRGRCDLDEVLGALTACALISFRSVDQGLPLTLVGLRLVPALVDAHAVHHDRHMACGALGYRVLAAHRADTGAIGQREGPPAVTTGPDVLGHSAQSTTAAPSP